MNAITVKNLVKIFGRGRNKVTALDRVSFTVKEGSITGFLGANGAGKSTTINTLLGFIGASSGSARIFDQAVSVGAVDTRRNIGFLSSQMALDKTLTVEQELKYYAWLASGNAAKTYGKIMTTAHELCQRFDLSLDKKIGGLSTGNYQKVGLVIALMTSPRLLILDEPTNGLDPLVQAEFTKTILEMRAAGTTVFVSSHILSEVEELCDQFVFIRHGKIVAQMSQAELAAKSGATLKIDLTEDNKSKVTKLLRDNHITYHIESGDLEQTFMKYYEEDGHV
jgi:ABC-2 type transport system ATP-binding protein